MMPHARQQVIPMTDRTDSLSRRIRALYQELDAQAVAAGRLGELYTPDIVFIDPFHRVEGLSALEHYFAGLYRNVGSLKFDYDDAMTGPNSLVMPWQMTLVHPRLNRGQAVRVRGMTRFHTPDGVQVSRQEDYFDGGAMIYEQVPLLRQLIHYIKRRLG